MKNSSAFSEKWRRALCVVSSACLCVSLCPVVAFADEEIQDGAVLESSVQEGEEEFEFGDAPASNEEPSAAEEPAVEQDAVAEDDTSTDQEIYFSAITDEEIAERVPESVYAENDVTYAPFEQSVVEYSGRDRYETNAMQARDGWSEGSEYAVIVSGTSWVDALSASGLAGVLDAPILMAATYGLSNYTEDVLVDLGVKKAVLVGSEGVVPKQVVTDLKALGITDVERVWGSNRYTTQLAVYEYGLKHNLWESDLVILAKAAGALDFADALSASSLAFSAKAPVFLTNADGELNETQELALIKGAKQGLFQQSVLVGGETCVNVYTEGYLWAVSQLASGKSRNVVRLAGTNRWETSAAVATWSIENGYLSTGGASFASGMSPYDSLGGGALAGKKGEALLLVGDGSTGEAISALQAAGGVDTIRFFGGPSVVSPTSREEIIEALDIELISRISYKEYDITLDEFAAIEADNSSHSKSSILEVLNPSKWTYGQSGFYQFAVLSDGYSGTVTAAQIDAYLDNQVRWQEESYGRDSSFRGMGQVFIDAAKKYNVNEAYLLAHAGLESAWGCSDLAAGTKYDGKSFPYWKKNSQTGKWEEAQCEYPGEDSDATYEAGTYYNFCGIGAYDSDPFRGGIKMAIRQGWDSPEAAIYGAAEWISKNYTNPTVESAQVSGAQDTLWKMRWDVQRAISEGTVWHQYATSLTWSTGIASTMAHFYSIVGLGMDDTGLRFEVPVFKQKATA